MASIIVVGGKAINLDHVTTASWDAEARELTFFFDTVTSVQVMPFGGQSTEDYRYTVWQLTGDEAEEAWAKIALQ